jgi:hypothetical protein
MDQSLHVAFEENSTFVQGGISTVKARLVCAVLLLLSCGTAAVQPQKETP